LRLTVTLRIVLNLNPKRNMAFLEYLHRPDLRLTQKVDIVTDMLHYKIEREEMNADTVEVIFHED
jgi:hypothetical protein